MTLRPLTDLEGILERFEGVGRVQVLSEVTRRRKTFPIYSVILGSQDPDVPVFGIFGGIHGLERIGSDVVNSYLNTILALAEWDGMMKALLRRIRIVFVPLVNPVGMYLARRGNGNGVDLMRNAPVEADKDVKAFLLGGHRISRKLPWFRGRVVDPMEQESQAICDLVRKEVFSSKLAITLDVHSGFGFHDQLWFPYAKTRKPFPRIAEVFGLKKLLDGTYPFHFYHVEPQIKHYGTSGDLWDYLFDEHQKLRQPGLYLPLCLELGSWRWVRKNPFQLFSVHGAFNPIKAHRRIRILRRHLYLFDFLMRALFSAERWATLSQEERQQNYQDAMKLWFSEEGSASESS